LSFETTSSEPSYTFKDVYLNQRSIPVIKNGINAQYARLNTVANGPVPLHRAASSRKTQDHTKKYRWDPQDTAKEEESEACS
jgi:hypothetical protein